MKIVIGGAGEVGMHLAKLLSRENQDVILIDTDADRLKAIDATYNLMTLHGSPTSFTAQRQADAGSCDLFIAVTPYETRNILACEIAKSLGAKKTVARIDNYDYMREQPKAFLLKQGVDSLIYPEYLAAQDIITALERSWVRTWFEIHNGALIVAGVKIRSNSTLCGCKLKDIASDNHFFHVAAIKRRQNTIIPRGDDTIEENDIVYFTVTRDGIDRLREICGKRDVQIRKVLIMGGSRIAVRLMSLAPDRYKFKVVEMDYERCLSLPERCPNATIVHGDARDTETLIDAGVADMDAFVALTGSSETNILTSLAAKEYGVKKTIAQVENLQFISEAESLNIGNIVNKKLLASSKIFEMLLTADTTSSKFMALADADVAEIEAMPGSKITRSAVRKLSLPTDMTIAGLIRDGQGMLVSGETIVQPGDRVVVFCLTGAIHKIEKLFL